MGGGTADIISSIFYTSYGEEKPAKITACSWAASVLANAGAQ